MVLFPIIIGISLIFSAIELFYRNGSQIGVSQRTSRWFLVITGGLLAIILAFNIESADWERYEAKFDGSSSRMEPGFALLINLVKLIKGTYPDLLLIVGILFFAILMWSLQTRFNNLAALFYAIFPLILDINQTRNLIMYLILIVSFYFLENKNIIKFYVVLFISASFHFMALAYVPLYFLIDTARRRFYQIIIFLGLSLSIVVIAVQLLLPRILQIFDNKYLQYYSHYAGRFLWFYFAIQVIHEGLDIYTVWWIDRQIANKVEPRDQRKLEVLFRSQIYTALYLPIVAFYDEVYRFRRNAQLIKYIYAVVSIKYLTTRQRLLVIGLISANLLLTLIMLYRTGDFFLFGYIDQNSLLLWVTSLIGGGS